jgi:predicted ATP-dependent endonuclease of OLD family
MRLISIELGGYRRFGIGTKIEVDGPLTAIVGPNEAGKTSLLQAMLRLGDDKPIENPDRTRDMSVANDHVVVAALYLLDPDDLADLRHLPLGKGTARPRWFTLKKLAGGRREPDLIPPLSRGFRPRREAARALRAVRKKALWDPEDYDGTPLSDERLDDLIGILEGRLEKLAEETIGLISEAVAALRDLGDDDLDELAKTLDELTARERSPHPNDEACGILMARRPDFLLFDEEERDLATDYNLNDVAGTPPPALANLTRLAGLDLVELNHLISADETGTVSERLRRANHELAKEFASWTQGKEDLAVEIDRGREAGWIRIGISNPSGGYSKLEEHSDGLKWFVALVALTAREHDELPPVVLIDEAERHLHYDGQADLIQVFSRQEALPQIIYTTHSAGCLPEDLGSAVRFIVPEEDGIHSRIENQFWTRGEGFSPLLLGMGASTLAFVPVRDAVMAEGASELILLPTLFREVLRIKSIGFQIAPASASAPEAHIAGLDLEAPTVAWVTDGDEGGRKLRRKLRRRKIPDERIVVIGGEDSGLALEDLLDRDVYLDAINEQLRRSGKKKSVPREALEGINRPQSLKAWCRTNRIKTPEKIDVANTVLERRRRHPALVDKSKVSVLKALHRDLKRIFD